MRTGIYCRVSSEEQQEKGTIQNQIEFGEKYCDLHQLEIVEWYKDDGVTGTIPLEDREEGKKLLEDARNKKLDLLLIYRLDRLGRSARIILNSVYELEQCGVKIRSMTEPFDTGDPNGRFLLTVLAGVADLERETILERMWHGANRAAKEGKWLGGIVPYGYLVDEEGYLAVNEAPLPGMEMSEADIVRLIYRLVGEQGMSTIKVADYLNALGVPTSYSKDNRQVKKGKRKVNTAGIWRPGRIGSIVKNTTYKGVHYYGKRSKKEREPVPRETPAIVSEELWEKGRQALKKNQLEAMKNSKREYLLRGLIKCGTCGLTYHGTYYGKKGKEAYYVCNGKRPYNGPLDGKCTSKNIPAEWIENLVWEDCVNFILNPKEAITKLAESIEEKRARKENYEAEIKAVKNALQEKEKEKDSILELFRRKIISINDVERQMQKITKEANELNLRFEELKEQAEVQTKSEEECNSAEELLQGLQSKISGEVSFKDRREVVLTLIDKIVVDTFIDERNHKKAKIALHYNFVKDVNCTDMELTIPP